MAMLHQQLSIQSVTFQQDSNEGSRTTLHLIEPERNLQGGGPITDNPARADNAAATPPKAKVPDPPPEFLPPG